MVYYVTYYIKKYWYIFTLLIIAILGAFLLHINDVTLVTYFDKFENKISYEPEFYKETQVDKEYLSNIVVGVPYIGTHSRNYIPTSIEGTSGEREYLKQLEKDPTFMYKKNIDWSSGEITHDQYEELIELIGYHLNNNNNKTTILVSIPVIDVLEEYGQKVLYYIEDDGTLNLNVFVEEIDEKTVNKKTYNYTYKLRYDMDSKIIIR